MIDVVFAVIQYATISQRSCTHSGSHSDRANGEEVLILGLALIFELSCCPTSSCCRNNVRRDVEGES